MHLNGFKTGLPATRLSAAAVINLSSLVLRCFRALPRFVRSPGRPSQDIVSMSTVLVSCTGLKSRPRPGPQILFEAQARQGRTSALVTLTCQDMHRVLRMLLGWNVWSLHSCPAYVVHVSLPCADNTGIVDRPLRLHRHLGACPHSSRETSES